MPCPSPSTTSSAPRSDLYFGGSRQGRRDSASSMHHPRTDVHSTIRPSCASTATRSIRPRVFDLDAGPVTITLPDAGKRFMSMQVINEDQYTPRGRSMAPAAHLHARRKSARATCSSAIRTLVDPADPTDIEQVHALQDAIKVEQQDGPGKFEVPQLGPGQPEEGARRAARAGHHPARHKRTFGTKERGRPCPTPDRQRRRPGAAIPKRTPSISTSPRPRTTATTIYRLNVKDVPVDGFWSISLYNARGLFREEPLDAYSLNNITAKKSADGSVAIQFGGCDGKIANCLPIMHGLELHGAPLSSARRNPERHVEIPGGAAGYIGFPRALQLNSQDTAMGRGCGGSAEPVSAFLES